MAAYKLDLAWLPHTKGVFGPSRKPWWPWDGCQAAGCLAVAHICFHLSTTQSQLVLFPPEKTKKNKNKTNYKDG
jgi:hypothetical protein